MKTCAKCKQIKQFNEFAKHVRNKYGLSCYCKECQRELARNDYHKHKAKRAEAHRVFEATHRQELNEYKRNLTKNPQYRIKQAFYSSAQKILKGSREGKEWVKQTGLNTREEYVAYMQSTIPEGYTLADYGSKLQIDHIIPCSAFDLTNAQQRAKCFHYTNLRLITKEENMSKGRSIPVDIIV